MQVNSNIIFLCVHNVLHKSHVKELLKYVHNVHAIINIKSLSVSIKKCLLWTNTYYKIVP